MKPAELVEAKIYATRVRDGFLHGSVGRLTKLILALVAEIERRDRLDESEATQRRQSASELPDPIKDFFRGLRR